VRLRLWRGKGIDRYRRVGVADWGHVDGRDLEEAEGARGGLVAGRRGGYFWMVEWWRRPILAVFNFSFSLVQYKI
jgi:hypothetical protein